MALSIVNNSTAIGAQGSVNNANNALTKTIKALSTGLRINSAADDASGLAVSEKLRGQISGLAKAASNAQDAISMLQTAEGAMGSMTSMVQRIRELAIQAGNPAYTTSDRAVLQLEVDQLREEIDRVSNTTEFNTKKLLNGDASGYWSANTDKLEAILTGSVEDGSYVVSATISVSGTASVYKSAEFNRVNSAGVSVTASGGASLSAVTSFIDATSGSFILQNTQELTIYANGKSASVFLGQGDTISSAVTKLNTAMEELGLIAQGSSGVTYSNGITFTPTAVKGEQSEMTFVGSESLIKALAIKQTTKGTNDTVTVNVLSSAGGTNLGSYTTKDGIARNILDGVDLKVSKLTGNSTFNLSIKNNATKAIIGANEGQTLDISIGRVDTVSLGIDNINITNIQGAEKATGKLDLALEKINKARSTMGAQMNRLEYTVNNLNITRENMIASESRIRDLDIAQASSDLASQQVVLQSATAMLAQANLIPTYAMTLLQ